MAQTWPAKKGVMFMARGAGNKSDDSEDDGAAANRVRFAW